MNENCDTILAKHVTVVRMKIPIIIVKLDLVPFVSKNLPSLEWKQPKSMNTEKLPVFKYIFIKKSKFDNLNKKIKSQADGEIFFKVFILPFLLDLERYKIGESQMIALFRQNGERNFKF